MRALLFAIACCVPAALSAETRQHGNLIYDLPPGWSIGARQDDGSQALLSDLPDDECDYCYIYLSPGAKATGTVDAWLAGQTRRFVEDDPDDPEEVEQLSAASLVNIGGRPGAMIGQKVDGDLQILLAVQLFGRMELVAFEAPAGDEEELAEAMKVFERDVQPLVEGLRFVSEGAAPLMPEPQPGGRQGVWWGTYTYWNLGLDGMMQMQISHYWLTFWPDGLFYVDIPPNGTAPFDRAALIDQGDMAWGTYQDVDGKLLLTYATGEKAEVILSDETMELDGVVYSEVSILPDGTKVDGLLDTFFYSGFGGGISGGVSQSTLTEFHPDGRWTYSSSGGAFGSFGDGGGFATSSENEDGGRYEVKDGLLLQYDAKGQIVTRDYIFKAGSDIWVGTEVLKPG